MTPDGNPTLSRIKNFLSSKKENSNLSKEQAYRNARNRGDKTYR